MYSANVRKPQPKGVDMYAHISKSSGDQAATAFLATLAFAAVTLASLYLIGIATSQEFPGID